jgi:hypothetical protein
LFSSQVCLPKEGMLGFVNENIFALGFVIEIKRLFTKYLPRQPAKQQLANFRLFP